MYFYTNAHQHRNDILLRGYKNGRRVHKAIPYKPYLFVPFNGDSEYKSLSGGSVKRMDFMDIKEAREFSRMYEGTSNFEIHGFTQFVYTFLNDEFPGTVDYDSGLVRITSLDIEVSSKGGFPNLSTADKEVVAITITDGDDFITFGLKPYTSPSKNIKYVHCDSERDLLGKFLNRWVHLDPDIVTGWNIEGFDIPYLVRRISNVLGEDMAKRLSPWRQLTEKEINVMGRDQTVYVPVGVTVLDYLSLYKKFTYTQQESYTLNHIAFIELAEEKLDYEAEGYESLDDLYERNHQMYIDYNVHDVRLVNRLEEKLGFIAQAMALAYDAKVNIVDALTSVRLWDVIIHNYLMDQKIVVPPHGNTRKSEQIEGAYVKEPRPGARDWVVSFDLTSLYPHLIMQYNISPETLVTMVGGMKAQDVLDESPLFRQAIDYAREKNLSMACNGTLYRRDQEGFLPALMQKVFEDRKKAKKEMLAVQAELVAVEHELKTRGLLNK